MIFDITAVFLRKFVGIELNKRTDLIAIVALMLSVLTAVGSSFYYIYALMKGADVDIYLSDQITINSEEFSKNEKKYLRMGATVAVSNFGEIGYDAIVKQIRVMVNFSDGSEYEQKWTQFVTFFIEDGALKRGPSAAAIPLQIKGGSALSRDVYFTPFRKRCASEKSCDEWGNYLLWKDFVGKLKVEEDIGIVVTVFFMNQKPLTTSCTITIDQHLIDRLAKVDWHPPSCWLSDEET